MKLAFAALAVLLTPGQTGAQLPGDVVCPKACSRSCGAVTGRSCSGVPPRQGQPVLARKLLSGE